MEQAAEQAAEKTAETTAEDETVTAAATPSQKPSMRTDAPSTEAAAAAAIAYLGRNRGPLKPVDRRVHWVALGGLFVLLVVLSLVKYATA